MEITIQEQLKKLRRTNGNTQEQLAQHLGISTQAISKWERGEGYPDIELLPGIAAYYDVTVDELLGVEEQKREIKIDVYVQQAETIKNDYEGQIKLWREAYREFPNSPRVVHRLLWALGADGVDVHANEIIPLAEWLLRNAQRSGEYFGAIRHLCHAHGAKGEMETAEKYAAMAGRYQGTETQLLIRLWEGERAAGLCQENILRLTELIGDNVSVMLEKGEFTAQEKIAACEYVRKLYSLLFSDGNFGNCHSRMVGWSLRLARLYGAIGSDEALRYLEDAANHALAYAQVSEGMYATPLLRFLYRGSGSESGIERMRAALREDVFSYLWSRPEFGRLERKMQR